MKPIIIISAYNPPINFSELLEKIIELYPFQVLIIDDGSYPKVEVSYSKIKILRNNMNYGKGFSLRKGFNYAINLGYTHAFTIDADLQDPVSLFGTFIKKWEEGFDVVYGIRNKREGNKLLQLSYKLFYRLFKRLSYISVPLDAGDFSLITPAGNGKWYHIPESSPEFIKKFQKNFEQVH